MGDLGSIPVYIQYYSMPQAGDKYFLEALHFYLQCFLLNYWYPVSKFWWQHLLHFTSCQRNIFRQKTRLIILQVVVKLICWLNTEKLHLVSHVTRRNNQVRTFAGNYKLNNSKYKRHLNIRVIKIWILKSTPHILWVFHIMPKRKASIWDWSLSSQL